MVYSHSEFNGDKYRDVNLEPEIMLEGVLFIIATVATIISGYSVRRRYLLGILVSAFLTTAQLLIYINISGISDFKQNIVGAGQQSWIVSIVYVAFVWGIGYILGGINTRKKENLGKLPGEDNKYGEYKFD